MTPAMYSSSRAFRSVSVAASQKVPQIRPVSFWVIVVLSPELALVPDGGPVQEFVAQSENLSVSLITRREQQANSGNN